MKTVQEKIAIMQAYADGKELEVCNLQYHTWSCWDKEHGDPQFTWGNCDYRIKEDQELKAYNLYPGHPLPRPDPLSREWMRKIINAVKAGEIT